MNASDYNGHVPAEAPVSDYDRGWQAGYNAAVLAIVGKLAEQAQAQLDEVLAERQAAA